MWYFYRQFTNFKGARAYCEIRSSVCRFLWFVCKKQHIIQIIAWQSNLKVKTMKICITFLLIIFRAIQELDPFVLMSYLRKYLCMYDHFHFNFCAVIQYSLCIFIWWRTFAQKWIFWHGNAWQFSTPSFTFWILCWIIIIVYIKN